MKKLLFWLLIILFLFGCSTTKKSTSDFSINFIVDKKWDTELIFVMFRPNEPGGLASRARNMGIDYDFAKTIQDAKNYSEIQSSLENLVNRRYQEIGNNLKKSTYDYSAAWESCVKEFSDVVTELTQHDWFYNGYTCVVSAFHFGLSNWHGNIITRRYGENPIDQRMTTAHEIILSHVFHISRKYFNEIEAPDHIIWAISEITAVLFLEDNRLMKLWGDNFVPSDGISGYHQLQQLEKRLRNAYANKTSFLNYLHTAIQLAKEMNIDFSKPVVPENTASFLLFASVPENLRQSTPVAIGQNIIIDNSLSVDLVEPINMQDRGGWWAFSRNRWEGKGEYYILFVPLRWSADGSFTWVLTEAQIYVGNDSIPIKQKIDSSNISFPLGQFKKFN